MSKNDPMSKLENERGILLGKKLGLLHPRYADYCTMISGLRYPVIHNVVDFLERKNIDYTKFLFHIKNKKEKGSWDNKCWIEVKRRHEATKREIAIASELLSREWNKALDIASSDRLTKLGVEVGAAEAQEQGEEEITTEHPPGFEE